jgi:diguanylate cyclase (GGDEF)-like protein
MATSTLPLVRPPRADICSSGDGQTASGAEDTIGCIGGDLAERIEALEYECEDLNRALVSMQAALLEAAEEVHALPVPWLIIDRTAIIRRVNAAAEALLTVERLETRGGLRLTAHIDEASQIALRDHLARSAEPKPVCLSERRHEPFVCEVDLAVDGPSPRPCVMTVVSVPSQAGLPEQFAVTLIEPSLPGRICRRDVAMSAFQADQAHVLHLREVEEILNSGDDPRSGDSKGDLPFVVEARGFDTVMHALDIEVLTREAPRTWMELPPATAHPLIMHKFPVCDSHGDISHVGTIGFALSGLGDVVASDCAEPISAKLADLDMLSGCSTRSAILGQLETEIAQARRMCSPLSIVCVDLDSFKSINDGMGHQFGDALLKTVALRLRQTIGTAGKVGRLSGDEFLILLPGLDGPAARALLQDLTDELRKPMTISGTELVSTCSMGLACFPAHGDNGIDLMRAADLALYRSKALGRDMFSVFEQGMSIESERKLKIMSALHRAVARDEFHLVFQPQYDISAPGRRVGLEVLLRWTDPDLGEVPPSEFIPLSHQCGLGLSIDLWVLKNALQQKAAWQMRGESLNMSINTSASSFLSVGFGRNVVSMIRLYQLDPRQVQIEVTEGTLMQKAESSVENLRILREAGVSISVDDFGTGFSSLAMIHNLLPSELKIDRSFVARIGESDEMATKPLELILALARTLGLRTVAEGIETEEQLDWLAARGCNVGQGYYLSPPIPSQEVPTSRLAALA